MRALLAAIIAAMLVTISPATPVSAAHPISSATAHRGSALLGGVPVADGRSDHGPTTFTADIEVAAGEHTVVVEYCQAGGGAVARFTTERESRSWWT
ncbi:hypothetical protein [Actinoplanes utahensis]|uniref:Uncharacterized protein n=1 Tax=Actinoplanes utahensis TaxID=1869 RepID=A0A0A6UUT7_ACTUT|nr:hypothetical protein [Actinoplanes utahensis]KHD79206.1 hypothetical protein MB27_00870 [Actinoplanes utahensis]GIF30383.1 hypothetical protein Aut01nite_33690 [Actinoplanes utahensis]